MSVIDHNHIVHIFYEAYFFSSHNTFSQIRYNHISSQLQFLRRICGSRSNFSSLRIGFSQMLSSFIKNLQMSTFTEMFRISIIITISFFIIFTWSRVLPVKRYSGFRNTVSNLKVYVCLLHRQEYYWFGAWNPKQGNEKHLCLSHALPLC